MILSDFAYFYCGFLHFWSDGNLAAYGEDDHHEEVVVDDDEF